MTLQILLAYEDAGNLASLVKVVDQGLIRAAATAAIQEAEQRAERAAKVSGVLGIIERAEARRLREAIGAFLPDLSNEAHATTAVM